MTSTPLISAMSRLVRDCANNAFETAAKVNEIYANNVLDAEVARVLRVAAAEIRGFKKEPE